MKRLNNLPTQGPSIEAYKGSPLDLRLVFPDGYAIPEVTVEIHRHTTRLSASHQPTVSANGQIRLVQLSAEQTRLLPSDVSLIVLLDGIAKLACPLSLGLGSTLRPRDTTVPIVLDAQLSINVDVNDIDRVLIAQVAAATAVDAMETTRQYRDEAMSMVGNVMTLISYDDELGVVEMGIGGSIEITEGSSPYPHIELEFLYDGEEEI